MNLNHKSTTNLLEEMFRDITRTRSGNQAIMAVESGDSTFCWVGTSGTTASGKPVNAETPFFIASIDKLYNATIAMMLVESGKLDISRSICDYIPEKVTRRLHVHKGHDYTQEITIRHLLTHTSGLPDWLEDYPKGGNSLVEAMLSNGDRAISTDEIISHVRERLSPHFPPQNLTGNRCKVRYSDTNFVLLAEILEGITGLPLHELHRQMLHEPLGLRQTFFSGSSQLPAQVESMILRANGDPLEIPLLIQSINGIYGTADDLIRFLRKLMSGEVFKNPETLATMMEPCRRFGFPMDKGALRSPNWPIEYGIGVMRFRLPRLLTPFSPVPAVVGHTGSTGCWLFHCPDLDLYFSGSVEDVTAGAFPFRTLPRMLQIFSRVAGKPGST